MDEIIKLLKHFFDWPEYEYRRVAKIMYRVCQTQTDTKTRRRQEFQGIE